MQCITVSFHDLGVCAAVPTAARARRPLLKAQSRFKRVIPQLTNGKEGDAHRLDNRRMDEEERKVGDKENFFEVGDASCCAIAMLRLQ